MAKVTISDSYIGRAPKAIKWEELLVIFDPLFGAEARSLPNWPNASDTVNASWTNAAGIVYDANSLEEVRQAYEGFETSFIYFRRSIHSPQCHFKYWPAKAEAFIEVHVSEQETACRLIEIVREKFPLVAKYVFISYADEENEIATFLKNILEKRLAPGVSVFVAKHDIAPGADPLKTMFEENLLRSVALVALCSVKSKNSPWLWWESSAVWARGGTVFPLFVNVSPSEFSGPIILMSQGRSFFDVTEMNSTLSAIIEKVCLINQCEGLTPEEVKELQNLRSKSLSR